MSSQTNALGKKAAFAYDAGGEQVRTTDPLGNETDTAYDADGNATSKTDANGHVTSYAFDADGRQTSVTAPDLGATVLTYDADGNVLTRTDAKNHATVYTYDANGHQLTKTDPLGHTFTTTYDAAGEKATLVDGNGVTTTYGYDEVGHLASLSYSDSAPSVSYAYDLAGNRTSMTDGAGSVSYSYDHSNRLLSVTRGSRVMSYTYDSAGRLASRVYPDEVTSYTYDADGRMHTVAAGSAQTTYGYDAAGQLASTVFPNGWTESRTYDGAGRVTAIASTNGSQTIASATYTLDGVGNPVSVRRDGVTENYRYDADDRVTDVCYGGMVISCPAGSLISYTYDKVGNRTWESKDGAVTAYTYDADDELTSTLADGTTTTLGYDDDGNETSSGDRSFTFNAAGQVVEVADNGAPSDTFTYDGDGNRLTKTKAGVTTTYVWDSNAPLPMPAEELNGTTMLHCYEYGAAVGSGLDPLGMATSGLRVYYHVDLTGSTTAVTDASGDIEWKYSYDPYGNARSATKADPSALELPARFGGQLQDAETGLYDLRARLYDPSSGRFLSTDPERRTDVQPIVSSYVFADDRPGALSDPSGRRPVNDDPDGFVAWSTDNGQHVLVSYGGVGGATTSDPNIVQAAKDAAADALAQVAAGEPVTDVTYSQIVARAYPAPTTPTPALPPGPSLGGGGPGTQTGVFNDTNQGAGPRIVSIVSAASPTSVFLFGAAKFEGGTPDPEGKTDEPPTVVPGLAAIVARLVVEVAIRSDGVIGVRIAISPLDLRAVSDDDDVTVGWTLGIRSSDGNVGWETIPTQGGGIWGPKNIAKGGQYGTVGNVADGNYALVSLDVGQTIVGARTYIGVTSDHQVLWNLAGSIDARMTVMFTKPIA